MKLSLSFSCAFSLALLLCLTGMPHDGVAPAYAANATSPTKKEAPKAVPQPKAKAKPKARAAAAKPVSAAPAKQQASTEEKLKQSLTVFAKDCISRMNKQRQPGINQKEVKRQPDGSYKARYMAVDPDSLETSYNPTDNNKVIPYIGRMNYHEVEYVSMGKDQKQALAGPFSESNRTPITELIKYKSGKWTY